MTAVDTRASDLLAVPLEQRDLGWLRRGLQLAVELELFTFPPYLCGLWSSQGEIGEVPFVIRSVLKEEMAHLGLAMNLLTAVGGTPDLTTHPPAYPGPLPGGLMAGLSVHLGGLTKDYVANVFMPIEHPQSGPLTSAPPEPSTGALYAAVDAAFTQLNPTLIEDRQLTSFVGGGVPIIASLTDARDALARLKDEGEGTSSTPDPDFGAMAHYYRFGEIANEARLVLVDGELRYAGDPVPFPDTFPMATVPAGGWPQPAPPVAALLDQFDRTYTSLLNNLQRAWETGDSEALDIGAIGDMFSLAGPATELVQIPLPDGGGNYGPQFRYLGTHESAQLPVSGG